MSITGGIKFFEPSLNLFAEGSSAIVSSGTPAANYALDRNPLTYWRSVGSMDSITETFEIDFPTTVTINRLLLVLHNFKGYTVKYDVSGAWTDFTSVRGLNGVLGGGIVETAYTLDTSYYEFAPVTTGKILISVTTTQTTNAEKFISQIVSTVEIGTFLGFPTVEPIKFDRSSRVNQVLSGKIIVQKSLQVATIPVSFKNYPNRSTYGADLDLTMSLFDREHPFIVWLCGGKFGTSFAPYAIRGFRLQDVFTVQLTAPYGLSYEAGVYVIGINNKIEMKEHV